jgi:hypothetical protein
MQLSRPTGPRTPTLRTSARTPTTEPGFTNPNRQVVERSTGAPSTTRDGQTIYALRCRDCNYTYGCNGLDIKDRRCPQCQGGTTGEPLRDPQPTLFD